MNPLLEIDGLDIAIGGRTLVRSISLAVEPGEIVGLVGESGSGKSLTALALMHLLPAGAETRGRILLDGEALGDKTEAELCTIRGARIGMVFQEPMSALNPVMTIGDQVAESLRHNGGLSRREARIRASAVLDQVELPAGTVPRNRYPHELSGGQRQRVAIAIAIAQQPRLLVADEPTTALDVTTQAQIMALLRRLVAETGMGLLLISHDLALVAGIAQRVAVMRRGEIVDSGASRTLFATSRHPYTAALVAAATAAPRAARNVPNGEALLAASGIIHDYALPRRHLFAGARRFRAVDQVALTVHRGESVALVGESGSGKTTLLRTLLALDRVQGGTIRLDGENFSGTARQRRRIQAVFQDPYGSFDPRWRVEHLVAEPLHLLEARLDAGERRRKVEAMLERVGLAAADADRLPHEFSGGQRQRIAIARALILEPALIAFDEATSALDVSVKAQILDLLAELSVRQDLAYLFVTHDLGTVRRIADRVLVMQAGRIVEQGPTEQIFAAPSHPYTAALIAAAPDLWTVLAGLDGSRA
ncbi:MAG: dipeptide ABC transporter ATP-binding protein [Aliidongia sp.]